LVAEVVDQSVKQVVGQTVQQSVKQAVDQAVGHAVKQAVSEAVGSAAKQLVQQTDRSVNANPDTRNHDPKAQELRISQQVGQICCILPPIDFDLYEVANPEWKHSQKQARDQSILERLDFESVGVYESQNALVSTQYMVFGSIKSGLSVIIYETSLSLGGSAGTTVEYSVDVFSKLSNGASLTISNNRRSSILPRPSKDTLNYFESADLLQLLKKLKPSIASNVKVEPILDFLEEFKQQAIGYSAWLWKKEQLNSNKFAEALAGEGLETNENVVKALLVYAQDQKNELIIKAALEKLAKFSNLSALEWEKVRDGLVIIHDNMTGKQISSHLLNILEKPGSKEKKVLLDIEGRRQIDSSVDLFSSALGRLGLENRVVQFAKLNQTPLVHVYTTNPGSHRQAS